MQTADLVGGLIKAEDWGAGSGKREAMTKKADTVLEAGVGRLMIYSAGHNSGEIRL